MGEATPSERSFLLSEGYSITKKLGQGSYSKVFVCEPISKDPKIIFKSVACKITNLNSVPRDFITKFFPRELSILMTLKHPNIIHLYGIYKKQNRFFIIMRLAENKDLLDYVITKGEVPEPRARFWSWQISSALSYMHSKDIVHRDLKCENVLLTENMNAKICDFGFAKTLPRDEEGLIELSQTFCGSLAYVAPEVLERKPYNPKLSDPWSVGVIIYVLLSRSLPFQEKAPKAMLACQKKKLQFVGRTWEIISQQARNAVSKLLEVEPRSRWTADSMLRSSWFSMDSRLVEMNMDHMRSQEETKEAETVKAEKWVRRSDTSDRSNVTTIFKGSLDLKENRSTDFFKKRANIDKKLVDTQKILPKTLSSLPDGSRL